jgi:hypothetical protein
VCEGSLQDKITIYISYLIDSGKDWIIYIYILPLICITDKLTYFLNKK